MDLRGKYVTFSCIFQENEDFCVRLIGSNVTIGITENGFDVRSDKSQIGVLHVTALIPSTCRYLQCAITSDRPPTSENSRAIVIAAKLELGPVQTLAHKDAFGNWVLNDPPPDKALELAKCQRYYLSSYINNPPGTPQTFENELVLIAIKNDRFNVNGIEFPARMRITPNVTFYAPGSGNPGYATESGSSNEVRIASVIAGPDRVNIGAPDNNLVVGHEYYLHYVADARL